MSTYSIPGFEEPFSSLSHLFAAPVFLVWGIVLIRRYASGSAKVISLSVLTLCTVFLLSISGVFHLLGDGGARAVLRQLDIAGVFALIAGTATPVHAVLFRGVARWAPLLIAWSVAATGITLRSVFIESLPIGAGTVIFLVMGWGGLVTLALLWRHYGFHFVQLLLAGGIAYSVGAIVLIWHRPTLIPGVVGPHELWHVTVLIGLSLHWLFVTDFIKASALAKLQPSIRTKRLERADSPGAMMVGGEGSGQREQTS